MNKDVLSKSGILLKYDVSVCFISSQEPLNNIVSNILGRIKDLQQKRVLDDAARRRRQRKALEALEQDNFQDDPHADLKMSKKAPKFEESMDTPGNIFRTDGFFMYLSRDFVWTF